MLRIATLTGGLWAVIAIALRATMIPAEVCPQITADDARASAVAAADWLARNQNPDGTYTYEYDSRTGERSNDYNIVRHAGVTMSLYQVVGAGEAQYLPVADRGLAYMRSRLVEAGGGLAFVERGGTRAPLGASALLLAGLAQRRLATNDPGHDELMRAVGRFIIALQQPDGSFLAEWDSAADAPYPKVTSRYATGEAFWGLALLDRVFPDEGWDAPAKAVGAYLAQKRDEQEGLSFPPWADQWAAYGFAEMAAGALDGAEVAYVRSLAERFGFLVRVEARRRDGWFSDVLRGPQARAAGLGTWVEGLGSLWALSRTDGRLSDVTAKVGDRGVCAAGMLVDRQVAETVSPTQPSRAEAGAWFRGGETRMDDQQHALSGLLLVERILREGR